MRQSTLHFLLIGLAVLSPLSFSCPLAIADESFLSVCAGQTPEGASHMLSSYEQFKGDVAKIIFISSLLPITSGDCQTTRLPVSADKIQWVGLIPASKAEKLSKGVILTDLSETAPPEVTTVIEENGEDEKNLQLIAPLQTELLPFLKLIPFGEEERVTVKSHAQSLEIACAPGKQPAGVTLETPHWFLPKGISMQFQAKASGAGTFSWLVSDEEATREDPIQLGPMALNGEQPVSETWVMPQDLTREATSGKPPLDSWTLLCTQEGGQMMLSSMQIKAAPAQPLGTRMRSAWAWEPALWQQTPDKLLQGLSQMKIGRVFVTVPVTEDDQHVERADALKQFIQKANAQHIQVWAVEGDPHAILIPQRQEFIARAHVYKAFNAAAPAGQRLSGIQYDIEPYILPGFSLTPQAANLAYLETIRTLKQASEMPLDIAVPFWIPDAELPDGMSLLDALAPSIQRITIMDYRTDPVLIQQFAEPFLAWGKANQREISIAVESGPLANQKRRSYRPAPVGELWHIPLGEQHALVLLKDLGKNPYGKSFAFSHQNTSQSSQLTFHQNKNALTNMIPQLEAAFQAWPAFSGLAFHEFITY